MEKNQIPLSPMQKSAGGKGHFRIKGSVSTLGMIFSIPAKGFALPCLLPFMETMCKRSYIFQARYHNC
jgi:hypothetical protein